MINMPNNDYTVCIKRQPRTVSIYLRSCRLFLSRIVTYFDSSIFIICLAKYSLISLCLGTGCDVFVLGFWYQSCFPPPPCRIKIHPIFSICLIKSLLFILLQVQQPYVRMERYHSSILDKYLLNFLLILQVILPESGSLDILQDTLATYYHLANIHIFFFSFYFSYIFNFIINCLSNISLYMTKSIPIITTFS